jgi:hypothetical protein
MKEDEVARIAAEYFKASLKQALLLRLKSLPLSSLP